MIDTHAHIDSSSFDIDRKDIIERSLKSGVEFIIIPAIKEDGFQNIIDLTTEYDELYCGMGVHPHNALEYTDSTTHSIKEYAKYSKVISIGETGLDYYYDFAPKTVQKDVFSVQLNIAKELGLPVIVHNREADKDILDILKNEQDGNLIGVLHCFSSSVDTLKKGLDLNFNVSFTGNITFNKSKLVEVVNYAPLEKIMLETDSPYMTPVPLRGKRNEPVNVKYVAQKIAEIKNITIDEVISMTSNTAKKLFRIGIIPILVFFLMFSSNTQLTAQEENVEFDENQETLYNPFKKDLGVGLVLGTNTIIETYFLDAGEKDISYDGIFTYGGKLSYGLFNFMLVEVSYLYAKNTKIVEENNNLVGPNIHSNVDFSMHFIPNPNSRINFFGTVGFSYFANIYDQGGSKERSNEQYGMNFGLGIIGNIDFDSFGLLNLVAEWRLNFPFDRERIPYRPDKTKPEEVIYPEVFTLFSIPRFSIVWYPPLW